MTNPTMSAEERARLVAHTYCQEPRLSIDGTIVCLTEDFRQAEQAERQKILAEIADKDPTLHPDAMRRKTLEEALSAVGQKSPAVSRDEVLRILRALATQPSEPGEAA